MAQIVTTDSRAHHASEYVVFVSQKPTPAAQTMALYTVYGILVVLIVAQVLLFCWKRFHKRSYELVTLLGLWLIPSFYSYELKYYRFLIIWLIFSSITAYYLSLCLSKNLSTLAPRKVYSWFFIVYRVSVVIGLSGYITMLLEFLGLARLFILLHLETTPLILLWYGLYFGILGRDCAEVASDWMQNGVMGGRRKLTIEINKCAICQKELRDSPPGIPSKTPQEKTEKTIQLSCKHMFHEFCIRGWTLIGKKDICPICGEKVDLKALYMNRPWETTNLSWIKMLDAMRYLIVWNPIIFFLLHIFLHYTGIEHKIEEKTQEMEIVEIIH